MDAEEIILKVGAEGGHLTLYGVRTAIRGRGAPKRTIRLRCLSVK